MDSLDVSLKVFLKLYRSFRRGGAERLHLGSLGYRLRVFLELYGYLKVFRKLYCSFQRGSAEKLNLEILGISLWFS